MLLTDDWNIQNFLPLAALSKIRPWLISFIYCHNHYEMEWVSSEIEMAPALETVKVSLTCWKLLFRISNRHAGQFQFHSIPYGQFHIKLINSKCINSNSIFNYSFYLLFITMSRYSEYLLGIPTPSSSYSKWWDCHGGNISELKN